MTTPQPAALPELPEPKWIALDTPDADADVTFFEDRAALLDFIDEPVDMESLVRGEELYTADQMRAYALAALQSAQPAEVSDAEIAAIHDGMFPTPYEGHANVIKFARAILALRPQAVPMTDEVKEQALDLLATMFDAYENGVPCHEDNGGGYIGMAFSLDNETFHACADILNAHRPKAHHGITQRADGGEVGRG